MPSFCPATLRPATQDAQSTVGRCASIVLAWRQQNFGTFGGACPSGAELTPPGMSLLRLEAVRVEPQCAAVLGHGTDHVFGCSIGNIRLDLENNTDVGAHQAGEAAD